jgi:hypothetical protein
LNIRLQDALLYSLKKQQETQGKRKQVSTTAIGKYPKKLQLIVRVRDSISRVTPI